MRRRNEAGQALVFAAVGMTMLLGFAGLAIDMGVLRYEKRLQQTAADAAALAGASNLAAGTGGVTSGAQNASATNGFADSGSGQVSNCGPTAAVGTVCVQVNNPPQDATVGGITITAGPHSGNSNYVEVLVSMVHPTLFMKVLGINQESITARAVATNLSGAAPNGGCLYTLGPFGGGGGEGVSLVGNAAISAGNCGISDNGDYAPDVATQVTAATFGVSAASGGGAGTVTCTGQSTCPAYNMPAAANPLAYLTAPAVASPCTTWTNGTAPVPGTTYCGMTVNANSAVVFPAGIYTFTGNFACGGNDTISGTGVMLYFTQGAVWNCSGGNTTTLTAPSPANCSFCASQYDGVLIYQDPSDTSQPSIGGNVGSFFNGVLYFPASEPIFSGSFGSSAYVAVVAWGVSVQNNSTLGLLGASPATILTAPVSAF